MMHAVRKGPGGRIVRVAHEIRTDIRTDAEDKTRAHGNDHSGRPGFGYRPGAKSHADSAYPPTMLATKGDGTVKYMPDAQSYDHYTNEPPSSP